MSKMTEAAGTPMSLILTTNNPWGSQDCGRKDCTTCAQDDECRIDCKRRSVLYESFCTLCNPGEVRKGKKDEMTFLREGKGIYVGESSRSLFERTREHVADRDSRKEESHQVKHWLLDHAELQEPPAFKFRLVRSFKDPMSRQISEAVRIELRGNGVLNSKAEFGRNAIVVQKTGYLRQTLGHRQWCHRDSQNRKRTLPSILNPLFTDLWKYLTFTGGAIWPPHFESI